MNCVVLPLWLAKCTNTVAWHVCNCDGMSTVFQRGLVAKRPNSVNHRRPNLALYSAFRRWCIRSLWPPYCQCPYYTSSYCWAVNSLHRMTLRSMSCSCHLLNWCRHCPGHPCHLNLTHCYQIHHRRRRHHHYYRHHRRRPCPVVIPMPCPTSAFDSYYMHYSLGSCCQSRHYCHSHSTYSTLLVIRNIIFAWLLFDFGVPIACTSYNICYSTFTPDKKPRKYKQTNARIRAH